MALEAKMAHLASHPERGQFTKDTYRLGPQGFWGSGENGHLFSGGWGALVINFRDLGSKLIVLRIYGTLPKSKK